MKLLLVRHGSTLANEQQRYAGQQDVALSPLGQQQVAQLASQLAMVPINAIVTSPLQRARATAEAIAHYHTVPLYEDTALRELCYGCWEGATQAEVKARSADLVRLWKHSPTQCAIPGAEPLQQLQMRVTSALRYWYERDPQASLIWVTHAGVMRVVLCRFHHIELDQWRLFHPANASVTTVIVDPSML